MWSLYGLVAESGCPGCQFQLAEMYAHGKGVEQCYEQAAAWYKKSAAQDHREAQYALALLFAQGNGVEKDMLLCSKWMADASLSIPQA